jgi:hypothetical protein
MGDWHVDDTMATPDLVATTCTLALLASSESKERTP